MGGGGPGDQGGVRDPPGDHDVGARAQAGGDPETAEVGVGGQGGVPGGGGGEDAGEAGGEVVALDVGHAHRDAEPFGQLP